MEKIIITVVGKDSVGIIAVVCQTLSEHKVNILDISQTIVDDFFNMMMIADMQKCDISFESLKANLKIAGEEKGVMVHCQREEIFTSMHRV